MFITINGERKEFSSKLSVAELLLQIDIDSRKVAVEQNLQLVKRSEYEATVLSDGDEIEIVNFVGGGFTLVELSIVLVVIGLLVGGILIGQSLIDSVRSNRLVGDLNQYEIATNQFKQKFKRYPGDSQFFNPPGAPNNALGYGDINGDGLADVSSCNGTLINGEAYQFWTHLSQSQMIKATYAPISTNNPITGTCGGTQELAEYLGGKLTPSTKVNPKVVIAFFPTPEFYMGASKTSATTNLYINFYTFPQYTLTLENKMGAKAYDATDMQTGLVNTYGLTQCRNLTNNAVVPCSDSLAGFGNFRFYLAPI